MPRGPRLDAPGTLHHVIVRGIEQRKIVDDDRDRGNFVSRLAKAAGETDASIFAWALMTNHVHLLVRSGAAGLPAMMRRVLSGYATAYNRRHRRHGHLFQNRYKSIVCEEDPYFRELVRYIHLNPLRAGLVDDLTKLERYQWCGHGVVLNRARNDWQDREYVLGWFGRDEREAKTAYRQYVEAGVAMGKRSDLTGGGLIRSMGGWSVVKGLRSQEAKEESDERILGSGAFVSEVIRQAEERIRHQFPQVELQQTIQAVIGEACEREGVAVDMLLSGSRSALCSGLRKRVALKLVNEHGVSMAETARQLRISTSGVAQILRRNRSLP